MSAITVETLIKELEQVKDKQAKVVITLGGRNGGILDIDKILTPGKDEDYVILAVEGSENDDKNDAEGGDEG